MAQTKENFFTKLFGSLFTSNDPESKKKKQLKEISKTLSKSKFKFYKNDEILPSFAKLFYDIYKVISPSQLLFSAIENQNALKLMVINFSLNEKQHELVEQLSKDVITQQAQTVPIDQLKTETKERLNQFLGAFDSEKVLKIEETYQKLLCFKNFCSYDFYFLLKKFDSSLKEREFKIPPHFDKINAEYLTEDLKDFLEIVMPLIKYSDWADMLNMFKELKGSEPINPNVWNKVVARLRSIINSKTFDMMLCLMTKDPSYVFEFHSSEEPIIDAYLDKIRQEAENTIIQLSQAQQSSMTNNLLTQIFGTTEINRLRNYTESTSATFERKSLGSFTYAPALQYYKAFLLDYIKKDLREFADLILVRGTWASNNLSAPMSDAYNSILESSNQLITFDDKVAEDAEVGIKLKTLLPRAERDKEARNIIALLINDLNTEAYDICLEATRNLVVIAKTLKLVMEDYSKAQSKLIINWKELERFSEKPIKQLGSSIYKQIYLFVSLMQNCLSKK